MRDSQALIILTTDQATTLFSDLIESSISSALEKYNIHLAAKESDLPEMPTRKQAREYLGVTYATLNNWAKDTDSRKAILVPLKVGDRAIRYRREDVLAAYKEHRRFKSE